MEKNTINLIVGIIVIALSIIVLALTEVAFWIVVILLAVLIFFIGITRIFHGMKAEEDTKKSAKFLELGAGVIAIIMGVLVVTFAIARPEGFGTVLIILLSIFYMVMGIARIITGITHKQLKSWVKIVSIVFGAAMLILGIILVFFTIPDSTVILLLSITMMLGGAARIILAVFGKPETPEAAAPVAE